MQKVLVSIIFFIISASAFGQGLNDVCWTGSTLFAAGHNGVILKSTNVGVSFSSMAVGSSSLNSVYGYQANVWAVGNSGTYLKTNDNGVNWSSQVLAGGLNLKSVYFTDSLTGYITGANGLILKCSDGGNNWISLSSGIIENIVKIKFINSSTGYIMGESGYLGKTTNAGANWDAVVLPVSAKVISLSGYNNSLMLGLDNSRILLSSNNGANWSLVDLKIHTKPSVTGVHLRSETSFTLVLESGSIWNSSNSGASFTYGLSPMLSSVSGSAFFDGRGYLVSSSHNAVLRSISAGSLWEFPAGTTSSISFQTVLATGVGMNSTNKIVCQNYQKRGVLYACQKNKLMKSTNYGENWSLLSTVPSNYKTCMNLLVSMKDSSKMIVVMNSDSLGGIDDTCKIYRTTDYGISWQQTFRNNTDRIGNMITQVSSNPDTLFAGIRDSLFRSSDFGLTWQKIATYQFNDWCDIAVNFADPNIIYSSTNGKPSRIHKSTNAGANWFMVDFFADTNFSEMPCIATSNHNPNMLFHAQLGSVNQTGLKRSFTQSSTWLFTQFAGASWAVDISKDDPNLVSYGNVSYTPVYISTNSGTAFIASQNSWAEQLFYYDRANLFATSGSSVFKMRVSYNMPVIGIENISSTVPNAYRLEQNYPNPFNPATNIVFSLPERSDVKMTIYDIAGRVVSLLVNESLAGGSYKVNWEASGKTSGIYFCKIETKDFTETKKMILLK